MSVESLYETIFKRKSIRKYDMTPLDDSILKDVSEFIYAIKPLYNGIRASIKVESPEEMRGLFSIKAPHYLIASSESKDGYLANMGYMLQQADLYLSSIGLGSCWLGLAKPSGDIHFEKGMEFVIALAFGKPLEPLYRKSLSEFTRRPAGQVSNIRESFWLEAARLAPSASNGQPWYFEEKEGLIRVWCAKAKPLTAIFMKRLNRIDIGIAVCHIMLAAARMGKGIELSSDPEASGNPPKGFYYMFTVGFI